jgi:hypothetical protein
MNAGMAHWIENSGIPASAGSTGAVEEWQPAGSTKFIDLDQNTTRSESSLFLCIF